MNIEQDFVISNEGRKNDPRTIGDLLYNDDVNEILESEYEYESYAPYREERAPRESY